MDQTDNSTIDQLIHDRKIYLQTAGDQLSHLNIVQYNKIIDIYVDWLNADINFARQAGVKNDLYWKIRGQWGRYFNNPLDSPPHARNKQTIIPGDSSNTKFIDLFEKATLTSKNSAQNTTAAAESAIKKLKSYYTEYYEREYNQAYKIMQSVGVSMSMEVPLEPAAIAGQLSREVGIVERGASQNSHVANKAPGQNGAKGAGNEGRQIVRTNLGNEIDITPYKNHTTAPSNRNPGLKGEPNSSVDIVDPNTGQIKTRRYYGPDGKATRDVDMTDHGNPKLHPEVPHEHKFEYNSDGSLKSR
ncbi:hypothetical protein [Paenibacillus sp. R14(2021)]|uniref:hypothetical protein n=1 Tax=Paenibacillus sp. R14(2021) TaxID=2859228 RepID=UPI001C6134C1|nr:hypothetical protein [Paenibacillus sp. R14(2021)]